MASTPPQATDDEPLALRARIERLLEAAPEERGSLETIMAALDVLTNKVAALEEEAFGPGADAGADTEPGAGGVIVVDVNPSRAVPPPPAACECALS